MMRALVTIGGLTVWLLLMPFMSTVALKISPQQRLLCGLPPRNVMLELAVSAAGHIFVRDSEGRGWFELDIVRGDVIRSESLAQSTPDAIRALAEKVEMSESEEMDLRLCIKSLIEGQSLQNAAAGLSVLSARNILVAHQEKSWVRILAFSGVAAAIIIAGNWIPWGKMRFL